MRTIRYAKLYRAKSPRFVPNAYAKAKNFKGYSITKKVFNYLHDLLISRKFIEQYFENVEIDTFDFTPSKKTRLTEKVLEIISSHEYNYGSRISPDTHVIVMGEGNFFDIVKDAQTSPFFNSPIDFDIDPIYNYDPYYGKRAFGWKVHVVPGLDGFVILPKVIIETRK